MTSTPSPDAHDFTGFMSRRLAASTAFVNGDVGPLHQLSADADPATIFGPRGDAVQGARPVNAANAHGAQRFRPGATNAFDVFHQSVDDRLAFWVGIQRSVVHLQGRDEPTPMELRVTEIFRRDAAGWRLIHRHADPFQDPADQDSSD